jgi:hypothetical protein
MYFFLLLFCFYSFVYTDADVTDSPIDVTVDVVIEQPEAANDTTSQQQAQDNLLPQTEQTQTTIQDSSVEGDVVQQRGTTARLRRNII